MAKIKVLIAGESWFVTTTHTKGFDSMTTTSYEEAVGSLRDALVTGGIDVDFLPNHLASQQFPNTSAALKTYHAIILSDIGANTLLLHPDTFIHSKTTPNRLGLIHDYVQNGGGLMMIGGYLSFTGLSGKANYKGTEVEEALPVSLMCTDDRMEIPQGFSPVINIPSHPIMSGIKEPWPTLLGYNKVILKSQAISLLSYNEDPISAIWEYGNGRAGVFTSDCAPHWGSPEFLDWPGYKIFFNQMIRWLSKDV